MVKSIRSQVVCKILIVTLLAFSMLLGNLVYVKPISAHHVANWHYAMPADSISWPRNQALPHFAEPRHLDVVDLHDASGDMNLLFSTLQGVVNKAEPRIYLIEPASGEGKYTWLRDTHLPYRVYQDPWEVFGKYYREVRGMIIYDPHLPDSINVATTEAGLLNSVVVSPALAMKILLSPHKLPVFDDLQGRFNSALDAYRWEFRYLWPFTTHRMLVGIKATTRPPTPLDNWSSFQTVIRENAHVHDLSNRTLYTLDLSRYLGKQAVYLRFQDAFPQQGYGASVRQVTVEADGHVFAQFTGCSQQEEAYIFDHDGSFCDSTTAPLHRFADRKGYFIYRFVPPPGTQHLTVTLDMWNQFLVSASDVAPKATSDTEVPSGYLRDYAVANHAFVFWLLTQDAQQAALFNQILAAVQPATPYLGWLDNEVVGVSMASRHGVYVLAADFFTNMSVWSGVRKPSQPIKSLTAPPLRNKIYVTFVVSDGDNLQYDEHYMRTLWDDPDRGTVPLNWSISPLLLDAAPFFLNHYQTTASPNDLLIAGPSGAGYFYPSLWPSDNIGAYVQASNAYIRGMGTNIIYAIDPTTVLSPVAAAAYARLSLNGMFLNASSRSLLIIYNGGLPVSMQLNADNDAAFVAALNTQAQQWDGKEPLFLSVSLVAWDTTPADAVYIARHLDARYTIVRGDQFFQLIRQANALPAV